MRGGEADVIALQEVLQHEQLPNQAQTIADALGYEVHFVSTIRPGSGGAMATRSLTPHPILARSERRLQPFDDARTVAHVRIAVDGREVGVYTTHLHYTIEGDAIRSRGRRTCSRTSTTPATARLTSCPAISMRRSPASQPLLAGYVDSYGSRHAEPDAPANTTMNPEFFDRAARIDHIFAERERFERTPTSCWISPICRRPLARATTSACVRCCGCVRLSRRREPMAPSTHAL